MNIAITHWSENSIEVVAPVSPSNINIHDTGFAGSIYSISALTAWGFMHQRLTMEKIDADVVIAEATIRYKRPITKNIQCKCQIEEELFKEFILELNDNGKAKINARVEVQENKKIQALLDARIAVLLRKT